VWDFLGQDLTDKDWATKIVPLQLFICLLFENFEFESVKNSMSVKNSTRASFYVPTGTIREN